MASVTRGLARNVIFLVCGLVLLGCAATLQTPAPMLVGDLKGTPVYSIRGYTQWGEMSSQDARAYAVKYMKEMCPNGGPELRAVQTWDASRMGHSQLGWTATFSCKKLGR
jgi:hypothetical protein